MALTYPIPLPAAGDDIDADVLSTLFEAIRIAMSQVTGTDIVDGADISGAKIAAGSMPGDRIAAKTIATGQIGLLAVTNAEIADTTIKKGKLATATADLISHAQIDIRQQTLNFNTLTPGGSVVIGGTPAIPTASYDVLSVSFNFLAPVSGASATCERTTSAGNHAVLVRIYGSGGSCSGAVDITYIAKS